MTERVGAVTSGSAHPDLWLWEWIVSIETSSVACGAVSQRPPCIIALPIGSR
ncbi:MAG: hypothetical protein WBN24_05970 [Acidimicrobiia bacterium]